MHWSVCIWDVPCMCSANVIRHIDSNRCEQWGVRGWVTSIININQCYIAPDTLCYGHTGMLWKLQYILMVNIGCKPLEFSTFQSFDIWMLFNNLFLYSNVCTLSASWYKKYEVVSALLYLLKPVNKKDLWSKKVNRKLLTEKFCLHPTCHSWHYFI